MNNLYNLKNLCINNYEHGGSRVFLQDNHENRQLLCDTYGDKDNDYDMELKELIHKTIRDFFKELNHE